MGKSTSLKDFIGFEVNIDYMPIINEYSNKVADILRVTSSNGSRKNDKYKDGWEVKQVTKGKDRGARVWNATNYQLTHLLENGHLIVNKKGGVGWSSPKPHINPAYQKVKEPFIQAMKKAGLEIKTK